MKKEYEKCIIKEVQVKPAYDNNERDFLINVINAYENSKSMKITKPLRRIAQILRRKK